MIFIINRTSGQNKGLLFFFLIFLSFNTYLSAEDVAEEINDQSKVSKEQVLEQKPEVEKIQNSEVYNQLKATNKQEEVNDQSKVSEDSVLKQQPEAAIYQNEASQDLNPTKQGIEAKEDTYERELFILLILLIIVVVLLFVTLSFLAREVRWRKRHSKVESLVFPNAHLDFLETLKGYFKELANSVQDSQKESLSYQREINSKSSETIENLAKFNSVIDTQKKEIDRLKEGYDFSIKKNSANALISTKELVQRFLIEESSDELIEKLNKVKNYIDSYLEEMDIEEFSFQEGISIREISGSEIDISKTEPTKLSELHETVFKTEKPGHFYAHSEGKTMINKAKIIVYKFEE